MRSGFVSNLIVTIIAAPLAAMSLLFSLGVVRWLGFGVACGALIATLAGFAFPRRGVAQRWLDVFAAAISGWTIVAARALEGPAFRWLAFAAGCALAGLAIVGLCVHEARVQAELRRRSVFDGRPIPDIRGFVPERRHADVA